MARQPKRDPMWRDPSPPTALPFRIRSLGRMRRNPYHTTPGTHHQDVMLTLVLGGRGTYSRAGLTQLVEAGMVGLVLPGPDVGLLMADAQDPYDHFYCRFAGHYAAQAAQRIRDRYSPDRPFFAWDDWQQGAEILHRMNALGLDGRPASDPERMTPVEAMLAHLLALLDCPVPPAGRARLTRRVLETYFTDHLAEPISLQAVADHLGLSRSHLCRLAHHLLGDTLQRTWQRLKMDWAQVLLREPSLSVADVARRVGYADAFYFSKVFRDHTGLSPRAWRRQAQTVAGSRPAASSPSED